MVSGVVRIVAIVTILDCILDIFPVTFLVFGIVLVRLIVVEFVLQVRLPFTVRHIVDLLLHRLLIVRMIALVFSLQALSLSDVSLVIRIEVAELPVWSWRRCSREQESGGDHAAASTSSAAAASRPARHAAIASFWDFGGFMRPSRPSL
jgi:hypothetical protein